MTVAKQPGHRGERVISRKTIACRNVGCSGVLVVARVRSTTTKLHTGLRVQWASGVPHALFGRKINLNLGRLASRERSRIQNSIHVFASEAKQSMVAAKKKEWIVSAFVRRATADKSLRSQ